MSSQSPLHVSYGSSSTFLPYFRLLHQRSACNFAKKQIQWYRENNPYINFYVPKWFETKIKNARLVASNKEHDFSRKYFTYFVFHEYEYNFYLFPYL